MFSIFGMSQYTALPTSDESELTATKPQQKELIKSPSYAWLRIALYTSLLAIAGVTLFKLGQYSTSQLADSKLPVTSTETPTGSIHPSSEEKPVMPGSRGKLNVG